MIEIACDVSEEPSDLSNDELKWDALGPISSQVAVARRISELVLAKSMERWKRMDSMHQSALGVP